MSRQGKSTWSLKARLTLWAAGAGLFAAAAGAGTLLAASDDIDEIKLKGAAWIAGAAIVSGLLAGWGSRAIASAWVRPLDVMAEKVEHISARHLNERLPEPDPHSEVYPLVRSINAMLDRLDRTVDRLRQFTADAAHELRTPVAAAYTSVEVALRQNRSGDDYRQILANLLPALDQLSVLGSDMGVLADIDAERARPRFELSDMNEVVGVMVDFVHPVAEDRGLTLLFERGPRPYAQVDVARIRQVVFNLIDNALNYTPEGGTITVRVDGDAENVTVEVEDSGTGISVRHLDKLFDRFYRVDKDRNRKTGGSGLGLAICRSLVEAHRGKITVNSEVGAGTMFRIELPRKQPDVVEPPPKEPEEAAHTVLSNSAGGESSV